MQIGRRKWSRVQVPRFQTFLRKEVAERLKEYMKKHGATPYKAVADLVELGLKVLEQGEAANLGGAEASDWGPLRPEAGDAEGRTVYVVEGGEVREKRRRRKLG